MQVLYQQSLESEIKTFQATAKTAMWEGSGKWLLLSVNTDFQDQKRMFLYLKHETAHVSLLQQGRRSLIFFS